MVVLGMRRVKHAVAGTHSVVSAIGHQLPGMDAYEGSEEDTDHNAESKEGGEAVQEGGQTGDLYLS
jgi:hypothetical protein